jgi:hypothetical protein
MDYLDLLQWPAMAVTVVLVGLQFFPAALNIRGIYKNEWGAACLRN